jgi:HlyD family secretion protein
MKRVVIITLLVGVLVVAGVFGYTRFQRARAASSNNYQTEAVTKGPLVRTIGATGTVRTNQTSPVSWQLSGRIGQILVKEGDRVRPDQVLASLAESTFPQNIIAAQADLASAQQALNQLLNSNISAAQALQALSDAQKALADAQDKRGRLNLGRTTQADLDMANAQLVIDEGALRTALENYNKVSWLPEDNPRRAQAYKQVTLSQQNIENDKQKLGWLNSTASDLEIARADAAVAVAQARVKDAQREWDRLKNGPDALDLLAAQARVDAAQALIAQTSLKSHIQGVVTHINSQPGDLVNAGTVSFRIDDLSRLLIDVPVAEVDVNRIQPRQPAQLSFDSIQGKTYTGQVAEISPFGTTQNGVVNFNCSIQLIDADAQVKAGMTAAVNITVERLENVLLVSTRAIRLQNGRRILVLLSGDQLRTVEVQIGSSSDTQTQIKSGNVNEGDLVVLNPPAANSAAAGSGK